MYAVRSWRFAGCSRVTVETDGLYGAIAVYRLLVAEAVAEEWVERHPTLTAGAVAVAATMVVIVPLMWMAREIGGCL